MQLKVSEKDLDISETLHFSVSFDLTPSITLVTQSSEYTYMVGSNPIEISMPTYDTYPLPNKLLNLQIETSNESASCLAPVNKADEKEPLKLQFFTTDSS
jgi:hypothetical protein